MNPYPEILKEYKGIVLFDEDMPAFVNNQSSPINLDICCGNGEYLISLSEKNRTKVFLGIELQFKEVFRTANKIKNRALKNTKVARIDAKDIVRYFQPGTVGDVTMLFPDPWPKRKQKKHRIIYQQYFDLLVSLLSKDRTFFFKTDSDDYFLQVFDCYKNSNLISQINLEFFTRDFHSLEIAKGFYITAFERIFLREKKLINAMMIRKIY